MIDFGGVEALTFDCYGTLIDWETGLRKALRRTLGANSARVPDEALLNLYGVLEARAECGEFRPYRLVLREVLAEMAGRFGVTVREPEALAESIAEWPAFADSPA